MVKQKEIAIVYMCAGISSRFGGKIKQFAKVGPIGETLIEYSLNQATNAGFTKIIFIVGNKTELPFKEKFGNDYRGIPIEYVLQKYDVKIRDKPWGTTDALCTIKDIIACPFVVCNGDDIYGENTFKLLAEHLKKENDEATIGYKLCEVIPDFGKTNRGIFQIDNKYVESLKEVLSIEKNNLSATNNTPDDLCSMNIYALHPKTVNLLSKSLKRFKLNNKDNKKIECLLPEELSNLLEKEKIKMKIYPSNDLWIGVTNPEDEPIVRKKLIEISKKT
ncbi:MAG: sugar phosphate nucleotidyltransferase [Nanoarchaeota archaeon]|nr:sugar phosphate nucleotidyltransferase [Nanoarchaeota archaeon]